MNEPSRYPNIDPQLEARLVALVLGEASDFERDELNRLVAERPELATFRDEMQNIHELLREVGDGEIAANDHGWKLGTDKRKKLLDVLSGSANTTVTQIRRNSPVIKSGRRPFVRNRIFLGLVSTATVLLAAVFLGGTFVQRHAVEVAHSASGRPLYDKDLNGRVSGARAGSVLGDVELAEQLLSSEDEPVDSTRRYRSALGAIGEAFDFDLTTESNRTTESNDTTDFEWYYKDRSPTGAAGDPLSADGASRRLALEGAPAEATEMDLFAAPGPATQPDGALIISNTQTVHDDDPGRTGLPFYDDVDGEQQVDRFAVDELPTPQIHGSEEAQQARTLSAPGRFGAAAIEESEEMLGGMGGFGGGGYGGGSLGGGGGGGGADDGGGYGYFERGDGATSGGSAAGNEFTPPGGYGGGYAGQRNSRPHFGFSIQQSQRQRHEQGQDAFGRSANGVSNGSVTIDSLAAPESTPTPYDDDSAPVPGETERSSPELAKQLQAEGWEKKESEPSQERVDSKLLILKSKNGAFSADGRQISGGSNLGIEGKANRPNDQSRFFADGLVSDGALANSDSESAAERSAGQGIVGDESRRGREAIVDPSNHSWGELPGTLLPALADRANKFARRRQVPAGLQEKSASDEAFSTFSLHVSDVSFKLARTSLLQGQWPDSSRIRIEEFVNAFDYGDPLPSGDEKVTCSLEQSIHPFLQQRNVLRVALRTAASGRSSGTPLRLTCLLDNSGSMERPDRQKTVRRAFALLAEQLKPIDQVTLITFARQPRLMADKVNGAQAKELVRLMEHLPSEGGTNIETALLLAFEKAREQQLEGAQNRIILLTDGAVNLGNADPESLSRMVTAMRDSGIAFDAAGISAEGLNDEILEALTRRGDGRYYLLDSADAANDGFARQIAGALRPSAKNVKVQVEFNPDRVGRYKLLGFEKHRLKKEDFRNDQVDAAELAAAESGVALYQFEPKPDGVGDVGAVSVRFRDLATGQMVEHRWPIPYQPDAVRPEQASPSLRIAMSAAMLAAKLRGEPLGETVDLRTLAELVAGLPVQKRTAIGVQQFEQMIQQARQIIDN